MERGFDSAVLLASGAPSRHVWAFDSFERMLEPTETDDDHAHEFVGRLVGSEGRLRQGFRQYALDNPLQLVKGWFEETLPDRAQDIDRIALLHIDADRYESVKVVLRTLYSKISAGGSVVIDYYRAWPGARLAVDEFARREGSRSH